MEYKTKYCIVSSRPVKGVVNSKGGVGVYAYNWDTGDFEINYDYMQRIYLGDVENAETEEVTEQEFETYVKKLRVESGFEDNDG